MDWVEVIGYQHEILHTAVLAHLLRGDHGAQVASALVGMRGVTAVEDVRREQRLAGSRPVDLAAWVVERDGTRTRLAVEVKVDSAWTPGQVRETVPSDCYGVLLAVGYTALAATAHDLAALAREGGLWRLVRPRDWGNIVRDQADGDHELGRYARRVLEEAREHADALQAVADGHPVTAAPDRDARALGHWAYFHEVIRDRDDVADWDGKTLRSGPLLTYWVADHDGDVGDYLEFMGEGDRRSLCVKTYAPPGTGALAASRARLRELLADSGTPDPKRPSAKDKTCTAARWWLDDKTPQEASALVDDLQARLAVPAAS